MAKVKTGVKLTITKKQNTIAIPKIKNGLTFITFYQEV
jgi:hypothetical protein